MIISEIGHFIIEVGTIFKTLHVQETLLVFCTDEGLAFAQLKSDLSLEFRPQMSILTEKMFRTGVLLKPSIVMVADFHSPGYLIVDCKTRRILYTIDETNFANKECLKIEKLPFFDYDAMPYVMTLTATGLNLINTKVKKSFIFRSGKFKDFTFQTFGEMVDPVARLVYS